MNGFRTAGSSTLSTRVLRTVVIAGFALSAGLGLAGCGNGQGQTNELVGPIVVDLSDIDGKQVNVSKDNVVDLNAGDTDVTAWTGTVADPSVAKWVPGKKDGSAEFNPGLDPEKLGTTQVTVTNTAGKSTQTFTLTVTD